MRQKQAQMNSIMGSVKKKKPITIHGNSKNSKLVMKNFVINNSIQRCKGSKNFRESAMKKYLKSSGKYGMLYAPGKQEFENCRNKTIDSPIGLFMKQDYPIDMLRIEDQQNLTSFIPSGIKEKSTINPATRVPRQNYSFISKSKNRSNSPCDLMYDHITMTRIKQKPTQNILSLNRNYKNIKLKPLYPNPIDGLSRHEVF